MDVPALQLLAQGYSCVAQESRADVVVKPAQDPDGGSPCRQPAIPTHALFVTNSAVGYAIAQCTCCQMPFNSVILQHLVPHRTAVMPMRTF